MSKRGASRSRWPAPTRRRRAPEPFFYELDNARPKILCTICFMVGRWAKQLHRAQGSFEVILIVIRVIEDKEHDIIILPPKGLMSVLPEYG
jgi:hypothetical protein